MRHSHNVLPCEEEGKTRIEVQDPVSGVIHTVTVLTPDYNNWVKGQMVQVAFPYLTSDEREALVTGFTPETWKRVMGRANE